MNEPIHIISLGAGVQSSCMALMAAAGEITPMPVAAVFADTGAEPIAVYKWLDYIKTLLPFPVIVVKKGNLRDVALKIRNRKDGKGTWAKTVIPTYILNQDGSRGIVQRQCTYDFKMLPLIKESKRLIKEHDASHAVQWIGISVDEVQRMKDSREKQIIHRWPLVEARMNRQDCLAWMERSGFPRPPRSACTFCPYHSDAEWRRLKNDSPSEFLSAVRFELELQEVKRVTDKMRGVPFLHNSCKPLSEVDFSTEEERGQINLFNNECSGLCNT